MTSTTTVLQQETETNSREDIPLKNGTKSTSCTEDCLGGSKFINAAFTTLTVIITIALLVQIYYGDYQVTPHGSVATDSLECSEIGTSVLKSGGNSADAAIAACFCLAVVAPHVTGLDAEGQLLIYNHRTRSPPQFIDFSGEKAVSNSLPRLVLGLAYVHQQYSSLPWKNLVLPSVDVARKGFLIPRMLVQALEAAQAQDLYGRLEAGRILPLETLAETLESIANIPEAELYEKITEINRPLHFEALKGSFKGHDVYVPNSPTIGPLLLINLHEIEKLNYSEKESAVSVANITKLLYEDLKIENKFHRGVSSNIATIDLNDNYVSLVTGMYRWFGSGEMTSAGYVLDERPNKKTAPCGRIPVIITDSNIICGRRILFGANDVAVASQIITSLLMEGRNVTESSEAPRFLMNEGAIAIEGSHLPLFSDGDLERLSKLEISKLLRIPEPYQSCNIVEKFKDELSSHSDSRGGGIASRF